MPEITPVGQYSVPLYRLRDLLADSEVFRTWVGATDAADAKANYIYIIAQEDSKDATEAALEAKRPFALIGIGDDGESKRDAEPNSYFHSGALELEFEAMETEGATEADIFLTFLNNIGEIMADLESLSGTDSHLYIASHSIIAGPGRPEESSRNAGALKVIGMRLQIQWSEN